MSELKLESLLEKEFSEARRMSNSFEYSYDEVNEVLDRTIAKKGEYKILEESYKLYLKDIYTTLINAKNIIDDNKINSLLSYDNYSNDGPEFKNTKQYIKKSKKTLEDCKDSYEELFTDKKIKQYIDGKKLSDYYIDIYSEEIAKQTYDQKIIDSIEESIEILDSIDSVIDFLIENKNNWKLENEKIYFNSDELVSTYNNLLNGNFKDNETDKSYSKNFGTYKVPSNWIESKEHSTNSKFFYVLKGQENESRPNNISINKDTNKYSAYEHDKFKNAIMQQLSMQVGSRKDVTIKANGSTTDNGYVVYTFIIYESDNNITTTQYYIVGDYKYILVHETVFGNNSLETDNVAKKIVNSFKWK